MSKIIAVRSGGQSGADRGAMDAAQQCGVPVYGWCPAGGWAEDYPTPPGVLELYPQMLETPSSDVAQRTEWNIRDSTCCIVLNTCERGTSRGTDFGYECYDRYGIPHFEIAIDGPAPIDVQVERACEWLRGLDDDGIVLGIGGPRASEYPGIYDISRHVTEAILANIGIVQRGTAFKPFVVGITGGTGSGKTLFTKRLSERLGASAVMLSHDSYYKNRPNMSRAEALAYDFDSPDALDTHLLVGHLRDLIAGKPVKAPSYDYATFTRRDGVRCVDPAPIVLVEGMLLMCERDLLALLDMTVFMDADPDVRFIRRFERDCRDRGADYGRAIQMYLETAKSAHERFVEPFKRKADIVLPDATSSVALEVVARGVAACAGIILEGEMNLPFRER